MRTAPPDDRGWVPCAEDDIVEWRVLADGVVKQCRMLGRAQRCQNRAVAELNRGRRKWDSSKLASVRVDAWWAYCESHLYGRWVEDGRVWHWRLPG